MSTLLTLANFNNTNGSIPFDLTTDAVGNLFGTTYTGGANGYGTVFEITKTGSTYSAPVTLVSFNGSNGAHPFGSLTTDAAGEALLHGSAVGEVGSIGIDGSPLLGPEIPDAVQSQCRAPPPYPEAEAQGDQLGGV